MGTGVSIYLSANSNRESQVEQPNLLTFVEVFSYPNLKSTVMVLKILCL